MILKKIKEIFHFHSYRYMGVDYRTHPYVYVLKCQKCGKRKYIFGKRPKCEKVPDEEFFALDSPLTALLRDGGELPKCRSSSGLSKKRR